MPEKTTLLSPVLYLAHGGGPLPLLGDERHATLVRFLNEMGPRLGKPRAILVVSAHWEEEIPTITAGDFPEIIYDYYGFPEEAYQIKYPAPGNPSLANKISGLLKEGGIEARLENRGFDHGLYVPLKLMFPEAQIPCIQISLMKNLSPHQHIAIGKSLAGLRKEGVLIIGSGSSFHNMQAFFSSPTAENRAGASAFNDWLIETCTNPDLAVNERESRLIDWDKAPFARYCHPREEHLLPLHVCFGAAIVDSLIAEVVFNQDLMGVPMSAFLWK